MAYDLAADTRLLALDQVGCSIAESEFCAIVGPSGCGKSTLLMLTAGLYSAERRAGRHRRPAGDRPLGRRGNGLPARPPARMANGARNVLLPIEVKRLPRSESATARARCSGWSVSPASRTHIRNSSPSACGSARHLPRTGPRSLAPAHGRAVRLGGPLDAGEAGLDLLRLTAEHPKTVLFVTHSVEEAVLLSDQVVVLGPRPGRILRRLENDVPKPRTLASRSDPRFHRLVDEIRGAFQAAGVLS